MPWNEGFGKAVVADGESLLHVRTGDSLVCNERLVFFVEGKRDVAVAAVDGVSACGTEYKIAVSAAVQEEDGLLFFLEGVIETLFEGGTNQCGSFLAGCIREC